MGIMMITTVVVGGLSLLLLLLWRSFLLPPSPRLPPGPRTLPIVGNLLMMRKYESIHDLANELKSQYGPIMTIWLGSIPWIILSGPELIYEAMVTQGSVFTGRYQPPTLNILTDGHRNMFTGDGERTKFLRKLLVTEVLNNKSVEGFRPIREREADILVENLRKEMMSDNKHNGGGRIVTNFRSMIFMCMLNLIVGILFGRRLTLEEFVELNELTTPLSKAALGKLSDFIPLLAILLPDKKGAKVQQEMRKRIAKVLTPYIEERKRALESGKTDEVTVVDSLLNLQSGAVQSPIEILDTDVVLICLEILIPGTETSALTLEYCIANLINHPEMQEKLAQEIYGVVGNKRVVDEDDIPRLPYLQAVVRENLRRHNPVRLIPRRALSATKIAGYDIPQNAIVLQHVEAVCLNPRIWENPLEFRPERFLNTTRDMTGSREIAMIPFGVGRRICPAINVAFRHAELILARLIQAFDWKPVTPGQLLDLSPGGAVTGRMQYPFVAILQERTTLS